MSDEMDKMVTAAIDAWDEINPVMVTKYERMGIAIEAALTAPTAEGWVWCDTCRAPQLFHVEDGDYECGRWSDESCGPYRTLLIATEVKR
jgi:hypothetical protein